MVLTSSKSQSLLSATSIKWRNDIEQKNLVCQISSLLLQRKNWRLLMPKSLSLTPSIFLRILHNTQKHPEISVDFFRFATNSLSFQPDLGCYSKLIQILLKSNHLEPANTVVRPLMKTVPVSTLLDAMIRRFKGNDSQSVMFNFLLENYSSNGSVWKSLEIFKTSCIYKWEPSLSTCKALLGALWREEVTNLVRPCYCLALRKGVVPDVSMWSVLIRLLCKEGKVEQASRLLNSGISSSGVYNLLIEFYSGKGDFEAAIDLLNAMSSKGYVPGFGTYGSILNGACKYQDSHVIKKMVGFMMEKELLPKVPTSDFDSVITKFCESGKAFAAEMFFNKAISQSVSLRDFTYLCLLKAFCRGRRVRESLRFYELILAKGIRIDVSCNSALVSVICHEEPSEEAILVLNNVISSGFVPSGSDLARYVSSLCNERKWLNAESILNLVLDKGLLPDALSCCSLVDYYCSRDQIDMAVALHDKIENLGGSLDVMSYNLLLDGLCAARRTDEAVKVFNYMRRRNTVNSKSFLTMISALCSEKKMRKAMEFHDEMIKKGFKPDEDAYKRLILGFV